ncbi:hypothetical protein K474DRAFT_1704492 [Panus rudis PR-1116 ss-1]|nr:hypothetical protein K474DRAFT_1704492 [Panus rudis PR-1116 ss-1]
MSQSGDRFCVVLTILLWLVVNGFDAVWLYFYVMACVNPNPRTAVNITHSKFAAYEGMMFFFGFVWGVVNLAMAGIYYTLAFGGRRVLPPVLSFLMVLFNVLIMFPIWAFLVIMPFFGGWIVVPLAQRYAWDHRCDSYPMYAILDAKAYNGPRYVPNVAHFYQRGQSQSLFTFDINENEDGDLWGFHLREWDADQASIPIDMYPTLQTDFLRLHRQLEHRFRQFGTFDVGDPLSFNLTSVVPLNNTFDLSTVASSNTILRTLDKQWAFSDDAPSFILRTVDPSDDSLKDTVVRSAVTKKGDCTQLKVCLAGLPDQQGTIVGGPVLAPLGIILMRQADYGVACTTPSDNS